MTRIMLGIKKILTISTNFKSFENITNIVNKDDIIYGTFGIHPHETNTDQISKDEIISKLKPWVFEGKFIDNPLDFCIKFPDKN